MEAKKAAPTPLNKEIHDTRTDMYVVLPAFEFILCRADYKICVFIVTVLGIHDYTSKLCTTFYQ